MSEHLKNFRTWYVKILYALYPVREAGIAILMISTPLLERYLRQKNGLAPTQPLDTRCWSTLRAIFPALPDVATAQKFWQVYRNGFLHQATLSLHTSKGVALPAGSLTHDVTVPVTIEANGSFVLHPELFSEQIVRTIEADFATFAGTTPQLPTVVAIVGPAHGNNPPPIVLSTKGS